MHLPRFLIKIERKKKRLLFSPLLFIKGVIQTTLPNLKGDQCVRLLHKFFFFVIKENQFAQIFLFFFLLYYLLNMTRHLSVVNSKGKQVNLLNDDKDNQKKRKYHCTECQKSFTTRFVCANNKKKLIFLTNI